jgi:hypothetical protein
MDLMFSNMASGLVDDTKATLRRHYDVCDVIYNNVAVLNSVSLKALSNEPIFDTIGWKVSMLQESLFPHPYFQHVLCEVDYGSFVTFTTLNYC